MTSKAVWTAPRLAMATILAAFLPVIAGGCLKETKTNPVAGHDVKVTFIHTSDWHSRLLPYALEVSVTDQRLGQNRTSR